MRVDDEFATGPFLCRVGDLLSVEERALCRHLGVNGRRTSQREAAGCNIGRKVSRRLRRTNRGICLHARVPAGKPGTPTLRHAALYRAQALTRATWANKRSRRSGRKEERPERPNQSQRPSRAARSASRSELAAITAATSAQRACHLTVGTTVRPWLVAQVMSSSRVTIPASRPGR